MKEKMKDKLLGCLVGGAVGDALGYPVEFLTDASIRSQYGEKGITRYQLARNGLAEISDDTQMTLFTANGLLNAWVRGEGKVTLDACVASVSKAYLDWYDTQNPGAIKTFRPDCWLWKVNSLHALRAPGNTCLSALWSIACGRAVRNDSKGCGGIMRVAPVALMAAVHPDEWDGAQVAKLGGDLSRLTHLHELGFLPSALFTYMLHALLLLENPTAEDVERIVREGGKVVREVYPEYASSMDILMELMERAILLAHSESTDAEALEQLGEGWVAEETFAVAVFCLLRYWGDFEKAVVVAVNHDGDSDSTGAVAGNLVGALVGYKAIPEYYKENLELLPVIKEIGEDLYLSGQPDDGTDVPDWKQKYR